MEAENTEETGFFTNMDYLQSLHSAFCIAAEATTYTKEDEIRKKRITRRVLRLTDSIISEIHQEFFGSDKEEE